MRALELSQEEFAARFHIPPGTLRDWEPGRREPDVVQRTGAASLEGLARVLPVLNWIVSRFRKARHDVASALMMLISAGMDLRTTD